MNAQRTSAGNDPREQQDDTPCAWPVYLDTVVAESPAPRHILISLLAGLWSLLRPRHHPPVALQ